MRTAIFLLALTALGACGVDGPPIRPSLNTGVSVSAGGVHTHSSVNVGIGNRVNVGIGL